MTLAVETAHLSRRYGSRVAVDDLGLRVPRGCVYGFLGPNGAGKTTTIRMLLGLIRPTSGTISLVGTSHAHELMRARGRVGAIVESPAAFSHLTARENLELRRRLRGGVDRDAVRTALDLVGLTHAADRRVHTFSLGMRQRLDIAGALLGDPELLILDEPTNGLDPIGLRDVRALIGVLAKERGITIFLSSHLLGEVSQVATHIGLIHEGRLHFQGTIEAFRGVSSAATLIEVDDPARAAGLLTPVHGPVRVDGATVVVDHLADPAAANAHLVRHGIRVVSLRRETASLEAVFFRLTGGAGPAGADRRTA